MARVDLATEIFEHFNRFLQHMARFEIGNDPAPTNEIVLSIDVISHSPVIGQPVNGGERELVIGPRVA